MTKYIGLLIGLVIVVTALAWVFHRPAGAVRLEPDNAEMVALGKRIYKAQCASCHGAYLQGETSDWQKRDAGGYLPAPPHDASGHTWHHTDKVLFDLTKYGPQGFAGSDYKTRMPAYAGRLSDREIIAVLSFLKSQWPAQIRNRHDKINAQASQGQRR